MAADEEVEDGEWGEDELRITDDLIDQDMPCLRCGYNLRGLKPEGRCPECGASIEKTIAYVMQRILCPTCLRPNHVSAAVCVHCTGAIQGAAGTANYYRTMPTAGGRRTSRQDKKAEDEEEQYERNAPSPVLMIFCWCVGLPPWLALVLGIVSLWNDTLGAYSTTGSSLIVLFFWSVLGVGLGGLVPFALIFGSTRRYLRKRRGHLKWLERCGAAGTVGEETEPEEEGEKGREKEAGKDL